MCLGGEIGRRTGLKILWEFIPCRFKSGPRHQKLCGSSSVGRASAFQAECREFDPRFPLHMSH